MLDIKFDDTELQTPNNKDYRFFTVSVISEGAHTNEWVLLFISATHILQKAIGFQSASVAFGEDIGENRCKVYINIKKNTVPEQIFAATIIAINEADNNYKTYKNFALPQGCVLEELKQSILKFKTP